VGQKAVCPDCPDPYEIWDEIWLLDPVQRWDRSEFDTQVQINPVPLDLSKARKHLAAAGLDGLRSATILDVGCGRGDLTSGLIESDQVQDSAVYAFDHSVESVRQAAGIARSSNKIGCISRYKTHRSSFFLKFFRCGDWIRSSSPHSRLPRLPRFGSRVLKPNGIAIFSEPFFGGYFWPCLLIKQASEDLGLDLSQAEFGLGQTVIDFVAVIARESEDPTALEKLADKHFFPRRGNLEGRSGGQLSIRESLKCYSARILCRLDGTFLGRICHKAFWAEARRIASI
jgi:SAM-dependent methyltransferase